MMPAIDRTSHRRIAPTAFLRRTAVRRRPEGLWRPIEWAGLDAIVTQLRLADVYEKVAFEPEAG